VKKLIIVCLSIHLLFLSSICTAEDLVPVKGYSREDGTWVKPHSRTKPDGNPYNNRSYSGNHDSESLIGAAIELYVAVRQACEFFHSLWKPQENSNTIESPQLLPETSHYISPPKSTEIKDVEISQPPPFPKSNLLKEGNIYRTFPPISNCELIREVKLINGSIIKAKEVRKNDNKKVCSISVYIVTTLDGKKKKIGSDQIKSIDFVPTKKQ